MSAILEIFLNTFWQAAAVALVVWAGLRWMPRVNAATRGAVWWAVLAFVLLLPAIRVASERPPLRAHAGVAPTVVMRPEPALREEVPLPPAPIPAAAGTEPPIRMRAGSWPAFFLLLWFAICMAQLARLAVSFYHLRRLKHEARPAAPEQRASLDAWLPACGVRRPVRLLVSRTLPVPVAVGFLRPAVLLPEALLRELTPVELDHVLLHELAHLARRDDWTNLLTRIAWAILALHPAAAFALCQIDRERELACDDWVVSTTGAARPYAASLARLFELCTSRRRTLLASGIADGGSQLGNRIALLLRRGREFTPRASALRVSLCTAALLIIVIAASRAPAWMAFAQNPEPAQEPAAPAPARRASARVSARRAAAPAPTKANAPAMPQLPPASARVPEGGGNSLLAALVSNGYGDLSVDDIVNLKNHGVSPDFIGGMAHSGSGKLPPQELIELKQQGVSPDYVREILALGFGPYTTRQVIEFKQHGVRIELFTALKEYGLVHADPGEIRDASAHGVNSGSLREAKRFSENLTLKQIIRLKQAGVI